MVSTSNADSDSNVSLYGSPMASEVSEAPEAEATGLESNPQLPTAFNLPTFGTSEIFEDLDEDDDCRAAPLGTCLSGCGRHWSLKADISVEAMTVATRNYDAFLSHEWGSSGVLKVFTLVMIYNLRAATIITFFSSLIFGVLRIYQILPDDERTVAMGYGVFVLVMAFWQRIREFFCKPHLMFLDKLCIEQKDAKAKTKGILSLPAFLKRSKTLLILWSPEYFQRLWCTFELVSFLREQGGGVQMMPVKMVVLLLHLNLTWQLLRFVLKIMNRAREMRAEDPTVTSFFVTLTLLGCIVLPIYHALGLRMMRDIQRLPQQLRAFRIQDSKCACCSMNHVDPQTGEPIACDRKLVLYTMNKWRLTEDDTYLDAFDQLVRENLYSIFVGTLEGSFLPFSFYVQMAVCANSPWLSDLVSELHAELPTLDESIVGVDLVFFITNKVLDFLNVYLIMILLARASFLIWRMSVPLLRHIPLWLASFLLTPPMIPVGLGAVSLAYLPLYFSPPTSPLPLGGFLLMCFAIFLCFVRQKESRKRLSLASVSNSGGIDTVGKTYSLNSLKSFPSKASQDDETRSKGSVFSI